jgi:predicted glycoside hydrolase/deacetylase ChbG (UPF0249 family)
VSSPDGLDLAHRSSGGYRGQIDAALIIVADDYGYSGPTSEGIVRAARAGAIDAASAMVLRPWCDPGPLLETGVEVGLHLEADPKESDGAEARRQAEAFERLFGRPPSHIDGHHHCHAEAPLDGAVAELALELGARVRSIDERHRDALRDRGIATPDRLVGRLRKIEPVLPAEVRGILADGAPLPAGLTEWMVHPGLPDPELESAYGEARMEDLEFLLEEAGNPRLREIRWGTG